jgi:hypothetical protein
VCCRAGCRRPTRMTRCRCSARGWAPTAGRWGGSPTGVLHHNATLMTCPVPGGVRNKRSWQLVQSHLIFNWLSTIRSSTCSVPTDQVVTGIEPVFNDRLNPGNNLLVRIRVSRYWRYYVVGCIALHVCRSAHPLLQCRCMFSRYWGAFLGRAVACGAVTSASALQLCRCPHHEAVHIPYLGIGVKAISG